MSDKLRKPRLALKEGKSVKITGACLGLMGQDRGQVYTGQLRNLAQYWSWEGVRSRIYDQPAPTTAPATQGHSRLEGWRLCGKTRNVRNAGRLPPMGKPTWSLDSHAQCRHSWD